MRVVNVETREERQVEICEISFTRRTTEGCSSVTLAGSVDTVRHGDMLRPRLRYGDVR